MLDRSMDDCIYDNSGACRFHCTWQVITHDCTPIASRFNGLAAPDLVRMDPNYRSHLILLFLLVDRTSVRRSAVNSVPEYCRTPSGTACVFHAKLRDISSTCIHARLQ